MRVMRTRRSRSTTLLLIATVLAAASGLLLMHGIATMSGGSLDATMHTSSEHLAPMTGEPDALLMPAHVPSMHLHELLDCVWVLVSGLVLVTVAAWVAARWRPVRSTAGLIHRICDRATRGPPTSVRLSLVGIARC